MRILDKEDEQILIDLAQKYDEYSLINAVRQVHRKLWQINEPQRELERLERKERYEKQKQVKYDRGQEFKKIVKPGDVVRVEGTKDNIGAREVIETSERGITARKLKKSFNKIPSTELRKGDRIWVRDVYMTTHQWDKVAEILDIKIH